MSEASVSSVVPEAAKDRPVLHDVDVVVAGSGLSGTFAAIAAGRGGARTLVVERFGSLGGNIGPAMVVNGSLDGEADITLPGGLSGIAAEFMERLRALRIGPERRYPEEASIASYLAHQMMTEAGVQLLLSAWAGDPILEGNAVQGIFVECKAGRVAVKAKVTVDGTGDADIAARAGASIVPYLEPDEAHADYIRPPYLNKAYPRHYNDTQLLCLIADVDLARFEAFCEEDAELTEEETQWAQEAGAIDMYPKGLIPSLRKARLSAEFVPIQELEPGVRMSTSRRFLNYGDGVVGLHITCVGAIDASDPRQISKLEAATREQAFKAVRFYRENAPGFERAYLLACAPFLGMRGGPHIEGDHTLTLEECFAGRKCDDVLFRNAHERDHGGDASGFDVPYGITLPKGIEGLLVCGRGAAYLRRGHDPTGMRARPSMMVFGQAVGTAAAIAALDGVTPRNVDIKKVQRKLVADGIFLGDDARLGELRLL